MLYGPPCPFGLATVPPVANILGLRIAPLRSLARRPMMYSDRLPASKTVVTPAYR
jgi:hypothetical protein